MRKLAQPFMSRKPSPAVTGGSIANNPALALNQKPVRRPESYHFTLTLCVVATAHI